MEEQTNEQSEELEELDLFVWSEEDLAKPVDQSPKFDYMKSIGDNFKKIKEKDKKNTEEINNKVSIEEGKGLSTNDFNNEYKQKLDELQNYDDTAIQTEQETQNTNIAKLQEDVSEINEKNNAQDEEIEALKQENIELKRTQDDMIEKQLNKQSEVDTSVITKDSDEFYRKNKYIWRTEARKARFK